VADERYVIRTAVSECLTAGDTIADAASGVICIRGSTLPYVRLRHLLDADRRAATGRESVRGRERSAAGWPASSLTSSSAKRRPSSSRSLGFPVRAGVSGTTVMSDGHVSLIVDVAPLLDLAHRRASTRSSPSLSLPRLAATEPILS